MCRGGRGVPVPDVTSGVAGSNIYDFGRLQGLAGRFTQGVRTAACSALYLADVMSQAPCSMEDPTLETQSPEETARTSLRVSKKAVRAAFWSRNVVLLPHAKLATGLMSVLNAPIWTSGVARTSVMFRLRPPASCATCKLLARVTEVGIVVLEFRLAKA